MRSAGKRVVALILAGGKGTRLEPLTRDRAKPAVPFGGAYRIIDFTLSNCINSGLRKILVLTQYKAASLERHIQLGWRFLCRELDEYADILSPQQRLDENWYRGTADAVYQNIYTLERTRPDILLILSGDHIYKMNYQSLINDHINNEAKATVACIPVPISESSQFGVMQIDDSRRITGFLEKPAHTEPMPGSNDHFLANMGVYVFDAHFLFEELCRDATLMNSAHDFGKDVIPAIIGQHRIQAFPFQGPAGNVHYWRDVGTIDALYEANMDLIQVAPELNLYDHEWEIRTYQPNFPPPKFIFAQHGQRLGHALDSLVCSGSIVSGGRVERSILSHAVRVNSWATVEDSILFEGVEVGRRAQIRNAIIDKGVRVPPGARIGFDREEDLARGATISESGVVVIPKSDELPEAI